MSSYKFGEYLKEKRMERNLSTKDLAIKLGCDESVVEKQEQYIGWMPNDNGIVKIAEALDIPKEEIFLKAYPLEELLSYKNFYLSKLGERNVHIEYTDYMKDGLENESELEIYLRPLPKQGIYGVMSPVAKVKEQEIYTKTDDMECYDSEYFSRSHFEIVAIEAGEYHEWENHVVIGHLTGRIINTELLYDDLNYNDGMHSFYDFDAASAITEALWCDFKEGTLSSILSERMYGESLYLLNNISIDEKYASVELFETVLRLIPYMFSNQFNTEISHILYTKDVTELDDDYMDVNKETQVGLNVKEELECLNRLGAKEYQSFRGYSYFTMTCNRTFCTLRWVKEW